MTTPLRIIFIAILLSFSSITFACINPYASTIDLPREGDSLKLSFFLNPPAKDKLPYWHHGFSDDLNLFIEFERVNGKDISKFSYREKSDYAIMQLKLGDKQEGLQILEELYKQHPNEYNIVANLGTAYELNGNNAKALEFLKKALALNPGSHYHSEWIHVNILEQELSDSPDYTKIINLGIKDFQGWLIDKTYKFPQEADSLKVQLAYQLHERISFIDKPNKVIGQLVLDFADIIAKTGNKNDAYQFYNFALSYDSSLKKTIETRVGGVKSEQKVVKEKFQWASIIWAIPLAALGLVFLAWLKAMKQKKQAK
ncbi:tetratricopeptide repeat protein [Pseudoflavitalea sp. G-6-1-2]|uniref:tetratricopeptide repeat protein n=1 Tax=Pseudoflavitalea sp. G-6-1-2 TaxID=2728841 RepID=UPI00146C8400|nr:tetratricopeptide repeat protein [Pseudoflavitalea sp. G-6-1-2]NML19443.1 tetratricopeptide repeat protein [Pseudoflavitalea sp. G-6-1-2]